MSCLIIFVFLFLFKKLIVFGFFKKFAFVLNVKKYNSEKVKKNNTIGTNVYYINMDRSTERKSYILSNLQKMQFNYFRVSAVDGAALSDAEVDSFVDIQKFNLLRGKEISKGEIGCYKSHLLAWNAFLESNAEFALICEDDISFNPIDLEAKIKVLTGPENKNVWDLCAFQLKHSGLPISVKKIDDESALVLYIGHCVEAGCYLLNKKTAALLSENAVKMVMPLDYYYNRPFEFGVKFMGIEPRLVGQTFGTSEIGETKSKIRKITDPKVRLYKKLYRFASAVVRILYNISVYLSIKTIVFVKKIEKIKNNLKNIF